jgi:hypothetical protein
MKRTAFFLAALGFAVAAQAAVSPYAGFVYPAGGNPGAVLTLTLGGQHIKDFSGVHLAGMPVEARLTDYLRIYDRQEAGRVKRMMENLAARLAEEKDETVRLQMQRQIALAEQEMEMVKEMARMDKMNPALAAKKQFNPQISERLTLEVRLPKNLPPGDCELRVITTNGLSNPLVFQIGELPEVYEREPNDTLSNAVPLTALPARVNGQILPGETDCFRFQAHQGETLVFQVAARALIPYLADAVPGWFQAVLTLYDAQGREIAWADDFRFDPDPVMTVRIPQDGTYTLAIRDAIFRGREDFVYRLTLGAMPFISHLSPPGGTAGTTEEVTLYGVNLPTDRLKIKIPAGASGAMPVQVGKGALVSNIRKFGVSELPGAPEGEPNNTVEQANRVSGDTVINGTVGLHGDADWFCFTGRAGERKTVEVMARRLGSPLDARLQVIDSSGKSVAVADDTDDPAAGLLPHQADARLDLVLPADGTFFVRLDDVQGKGGEEWFYRLALSRAQPGFELQVFPSSLKLSRGGSVPVTVKAVRHGGFDGEIELSARNLPSGVVLERAVIAAGAPTASVVFSATDRAKEAVFPVEIEGSALCGARTLQVQAMPTEDRMQAFLYKHLVPSRQLMIKLCDPDPVTVELDLPKDGWFRVRPGGTIALTPQVTWREGARRGIKLALAEPPEWLTLQTGSLGGPVGRIVLEISPNAEPGDQAAVLLTGTVRSEKSAKDPDYNPVMKFMNSKAVEFPIEVIQVQVIN